MKDLAERMIALRNQRGLQIGEDGIILLAAKDSRGTFESLDSRFRMAGLPQTPAVLRVLVDLRAEAMRREPEGRNGARPPAASTPALSHTLSANASPRPARADGPPASTGAWSPPAVVPATRSVRGGRRPAGAGPAGWSRHPGLTQPTAHSRRAPHPGPATGSAPPPAQPAREPAQPTPAWPIVDPSQDQDLPALQLFSPAVDAFGATDSRLVLRPSGDELLARWLPLAAAGAAEVVYLVCAAKSGVPRTPDDGQRLIATRATSARVPNQGHYFAVFAYPVEHVSQLVAATAHRHAVGRRLPEVEDLTVTGEMHGVLLTWRRPRSIDRVQVMRSLPDEELPDVLDRSLLLTFSGDGFRDESAEPGAVYEYKVYTEAAGLGAAACPSCPSTQSSPNCPSFLLCPMCP